MDAASRRRDSDASDEHWASEDISVLTALLETPTQRRTDDTDDSPERSWASSSTSPDELDEPDNHDDHGETEARNRLHATPLETQRRRHTIASDVTVMALQRQVQLLQQEYDRQLEQRVAKSVVAAGGRSAPRASTIKLYRQYERLARVAAALEVENQRLSVLLADQQTQQQQPRDDETQLVAADWSAQFRVATEETADREQRGARIHRRARSIFEADAKEPAAQSPYEHEEIPRSSGE